jgi:5-methylcytosine-specific restriction endonuclease McrA
MVKPYVPYDGPIISRVEALAQGLTRFFPGSRCRKAGHLSQRMTSNGGCAVCLLIHSAAWQKANPEKMAAAIAAWHEAHSEYVREWHRQYSEDHRPQSAAAKRRRNAEKRAAKLAARVPDPSDYAGSIISRDEAKTVDLPRYYTGKPCVRNHLSERVTSNGSCFQCNSEDWQRFSEIRRARERGAEGTFTSAEIKTLFERQRGKCVYCRKSIGKGYHIDHVMPLARGGSNWITNLALACGDCNRRKGATDPIEFARRIGRLL